MNELATKAQFYRTVGVEEVWLLAPSLGVIEVWNTQGQMVLHDLHSLTSNFLPGFTVMVNDVLEG
jgi:Uma2 family endonuclease